MINGNVEFTRLETVGKMSTNFTGYRINGCGFTETETVANASILLAVSYKVVRVAKKKPT